MGGANTSGGGEFGTDPKTGNANNAVGQLWQGITGKHGATAPQLPQGFEWLGPVLQQVGTNAASNVNYGPATTAGQAGQIGSMGGGTLAAGIDPNAVSGTFGNALGSLNTGMNTGYLPSVDSIDAMLRPGVERSFQTGAADIREQNALTGNLSSTGTSQQIGDYGAQLNNQLNTNIAGILGNAVPASISARSGATQVGTSLPALLQQGLYGGLTGLGLQGEQFPLQALGASTGAVSGAPFSAQQGSAGNAGLGTALGAYLSKGTA